MGAIHHPYKKTLLVELAAGTSKTVKMRELPTHGPNGGAAICSHVSLRLELVLTSAATSDAITARRMCEAISRLTIGPDKAGWGVSNLAMSSLRVLQRPLTGRAPRDPAAIAADSNTTNTRIIRMVIPFADKRAENGVEQGIPMGMLAKSNIEAVWAASSFFGTGQTIAATTKMYVTFHYYELEDDEKVAPVRVLYRQGSIDKFDGATLEPGYLSDLLIFYKNGATEIGSDDFTNLTFNVDGRPMVVNEDVDRHVDAYNHEQIIDAAGYAEAPEDSGSAVVEEFPVFWPGWGYKLSKLPQAHDAFSLTLDQGSGPPTLTDLVFIERRLFDKNNDDLVASLSAQGADEATLRAVLAVLPSLDAATKLSIMRPKTISKVPLGATKGERLGALFPVRYDESRAKEVLAQIRSK